MYAIINTSIRQAMTPKWLVLIFSAAAIVFVGAADNLLCALQQETLLAAGYSRTFIHDALSSDMVICFISIFAVLPFSGTYIDDLKSKFARFYLIRSDYFSYLFSRILVCFLCGGSVVFLGGLLSWGGAALLFRPLEQVAEKGTTAAQVWPTLVLLSLNGGLWAVIGMAMSTLMESKYIAYCSPFVIYYLLVILCERYFPDAFLLYPPNWVKPDLWPYGAWGAGIFLLEVTVLFGILFVFRAGRRLREL